MIISTSDKNIKIKYGRETFTYPLNTISYAVDNSYTSLTLFRNNERIGTSPLDAVRINGQAVAAASLDGMLSGLFKVNEGSGGGGGSRDKYYAVLAENLPGTGAGIDSLGYITSDGTPAGELQAIYEWSGFEWEMKSFEWNILINDTDYSVDIEMVDSSKVKMFEKKILSDGSKKFLVLAKDTEEPVGLNVVCSSSYISGVPKFRQPENYYFNQLQIRPDSNTIEISGLKGPNHISIDTNSINNSGDFDPDKLIDINLHDIEISTLSMYGRYARSLVVKNIGTAFSEQRGNYFNVGALELVDIENVTGRFSIQTDAFHASIEKEEHLPAKRTWRFKNVENNSYQWYFSPVTAWETEKKLPDSFSFSDTMLPPEIYFEEILFEDWFMENCTLVQEMGGHEVSWTFSSTIFKDQAQADMICGDVGKFLPSGSRLSIRGSNFSPSLELQDQLTAKGIRLEITE